MKSDCGYTIYFTGLSGAGKTTLSKKIYEYLAENEVNVELIDGDTLRGDLDGIFGYTKDERIKGSKVSRCICKLLNKNGINVIISEIGPYKEIRYENRNQIKNYHEIYLDASIDKCIERDVKGLYERALNGQEEDVIGIHDKYEDLNTEDLRINTDKLSIEESFEIIVNYLELKNLV